MTTITWVKGFTVIQSNKKFHLRRMIICKFALIACSLVFFSKAHISENYSSWHPCCVTRSVIISFVCYNYFKLSPGDVKYHCCLTSLRTKLNFLPLESTLKKIDSSILTRECTGIHFKCLFKILLCIFEILVS